MGDQQLVEECELHKVWTLERHDAYCCLHLSQLFLQQTLFPFPSQYIDVLLNSLLWKYSKTHQKLMKILIKSRTNE